MDKSNIIKALGLAASVVGIGAGLLADWVNERKLDEKIAEKIKEAVANK